MTKRIIFFLSLLICLKCASTSEGDMERSDPKKASQALIASFKPIGVNTANLYLYCKDLEEPEEVLADYIQQSGIEVLRFPGGTTANFYHPKGLGYGYRENEIELLKESRIKKHMLKVTTAEKKWVQKYQIEENVIHRFVELAVKSQSKVLFVANVLNGSIEENMWAVRFMQNKGVVLSGIELGNEYYLNAYSNQMKGVNEYLYKAQLFAKEMKKHFPDIPLSVVAAPVQYIKDLSVKEQKWNIELAKYNFYDAISIHYYPRRTGLSFQFASECSIKEAIHMANDQFVNVMEEYDRIFGEESFFWITEWNVMGAPKWCANSIHHAVFVSELSQSIMRHSRIENNIYHTFLSKNDGYNLLKWDNLNDEVEPLLSKYVLEFWSILKKHLKTEVFTVKESLENKILIQQIESSESNHELILLKNYTDQDYPLNSPFFSERKISKARIIKLNKDGLFQDNFTFDKNQNLTVEAKSILVFLMN